MIPLLMPYMRYGRLQILRGLLGVGAVWIGFLGIYALGQIWHIPEREEVLPGIIVTLDTRGPGITFIRDLQYQYKNEGILPKHWNIERETHDNFIKFMGAQ